MRMTLVRTLAMLALLAAPLALAQTTPAPAASCYDDGSAPVPVQGGEATPAEEGQSAVVIVDADRATLPAPGGGQVIETSGTGERDALSFWYDSTNGRVRFSYRAEPGAPVRTMDLAYESVLEFRDADADGALDQGEEVVQAFDVSRLVGKARTTEGPCGVRLTWTYALHDPAEVLATIEGMDDEGVGDGKSDAEIQAERDAYFDALPRLTLRFTHTGEIRELDEGGVTPDRVKIDVAIDRFPFRENGTRVAVRSELASDEPTAQEGRRVATADDAAPIGYSWAGTALVGGALEPVAATVATAQGGTLVTLAYPASPAILHDPELGVFRVQGVAEVVSRLPGASLGAFALGALGAIGALVAITLARRR